MSYLIRKFDEWWLGEINIGLIQMTHVEFMVYRLTKSMNNLMWNAHSVADAFAGVTNKFIGLKAFIDTGSNDMETQFYGQLVIDNTSDCGYACGYTEPYGFVPECGCPVHDPEDNNL